MGYAKYVGRVGALAVALGIGTAVAGPAWADTPTTDSEASSSSSDLGNSPESRVGTRSPSSFSADDNRLGHDADDSDDEDDEDDDEAEDQADEHDEDDEDDLTHPPTDEPGDDDTAPDPTGESALEPTDIAEPPPIEPPADSTPSTDLMEDDPQIDSRSDSKSVAVEHPPTGEDAVPEFDTEENSTATEGFSLRSTATDFSDEVDDPALGLTPAAVTTVPPGVPAPAPLVPQPKTPVDALLGAPGAIVNIAAKVVGMLLAPIFTPGPADPAEPPLIWAVLAFARREIQRTFFNSSPYAVADTATTSEEVPTTIAVLANDTDPNVGDVLTVTAYTQARNGTVLLNSDGSFTYTPNAGFSGTDNFTYTISDDASPWHIDGLASLLRGGASATAAVTITVTPAAPVNTAPTAGDDTATVAEDSGPTTIDVLANDTDPDGDTLTITAVTQPDNGTATFTSSGVSYTPATGFDGTDTFTYTISDGETTATGTITVTVTPAPNTAPVAVDDSYTTPAGAPITVNPLANDTDPDGDELTITAVTQPNNGTATFTSTGVSYTPATGFNGTDTFTYLVSDGQTTATGTITVTVTPAAPVNTAPIAGEPAYDYTTHLGSGIISGTLDVTDEDGDDLTFTVSGLSDGIGTVAIDPGTGAWQFKPTNQARFDAWRNAEGSDAAFSITVSDGQASITIDIEVPISPAFDLDRYYPGTDVEGAQSVVVLGSDGSLFVDNSDGLTVLNPDGSVGTPILLGFRPTDAEFGADGRLYLTDPATDSISVLDLGTGSVSQFASTTNASGLAFDSDGRLFVTSPEDRTLTVFNEDGSIADVIEIDAIPTDVAIGADGTIYVAEIADDRNSVRLTVRNADGSVSAVLYEGISTPLGDYAGPLGLAVGPNGAIYLTDTSQGRFTAFASDGGAASWTWLDGLTRAMAITPDGQIMLLTTGDSSLILVTPVVSGFEWNYDYAVDPETGAVSGEVFVLNPGGHLTFELTSAPSSALGAVTVDEATGAWLFVPTVEASAAAAYGEYDWSYEYVSDVDFVITASDGSAVLVNAPIVGVLDYEIDVIDDVGGAPTALAVGPGGRIYVANGDSNTITVLDADGEIVDVIELDFTPAGMASMSGGFIVVTNGIDNTLTLIVPANGNAVSSFELSGHTGPMGAVAGGANGGIAVVSEAADTVTVFSSTAVPELFFEVSNPTGIALGADGEIYVVGIDYDGAGYLKVYESDGTLLTTTLLGGNPSGIALGPNGKLYISDRNGLPRDVVIAASDGWVAETLELGVNGSGVSVAPDGRVYIADAGSETVTVLTPPGTPPLMTPVGAVSTIDVLGVNHLYGIAVDADGRIFVTGFDADFNPFLGAVTADGSVTMLADMSGPSVGVEVGPDGRIYVSDVQAGTVTAYDPADNFAAEVVATVPGAVGVAFDAAGNMYVTSFGESGEGALLIISSDGSPTETVGLPGASYDVLVAPDGRVFVSYVIVDGTGGQTGGGGVIIRNPDGTSEELALPPGIMPAGVAVSPDGTVFITSFPLNFASGGGKLVVRYPNGITRAIELGGQPFGLDFDTEGRLLITSLSSNTITVLDPIYDPVNKHAPTVQDDPKSHFTSSSGVISGAVIGADLDGDLVTYAVDADPIFAFGEVVVDSSTGSWIFTPSAAALVAAYSSSTPLAAEFTITASDGEITTPVTISVPVPVSADLLVSILERAGSQPSGVAVGADGTVYIINSGANTLSVLGPGATAITSTVHVGESPSAVNVGPDGRVWVTNGADGTVTVLDRAGTIVDATIGVGSSPTGLAFGSDGSVYVANAGDGTIGVINVATNALDRTITVGGTPMGITSGSDGRIYVADFSGAVVRMIDPARGDALTSIETEEANPFRIAVSRDGKVYVTHPLDGTVRVITPTADGYTTRIISVGTAPTAITLGANEFVYVTDSEASTVTAIDPHTFTTTAVATGTAPNSVAVGPDGTLYVISGGSDTLTIVGVQNNSATTIPVGVDVSTVTADTNGNLTVTNNHDGIASVVARPATGTVTAGTPLTGTTTTGSAIAVTPTAGTATGTGYTYATGDNPFVSISPDGSYAYAYHYQNDGTVTVINPTTGAASNIHTGIENVGLRVSPDSRYAYARGPGQDGTVVIINPANGTATAINTGSEHLYMEVSPDSRYGYASGYQNGTVTVTVINPTTGVATTFDTGSENARLAISPDSQFAYAYSEDGTVAIINPTTGTATTIHTGVDHNAELVVSPDGAYAYLYSDFETYDYTTRSYYLHVSIINPFTGTATTIRTDSQEGGWQDLVVSPDGRFAYAAIFDGSNTTMSIIDPAAGTSTLITTGPGAYHNFPRVGVGTSDSFLGHTGLLFTPDGRYLYANYGGGTVALIDQTTGAVTTVETHPTVQNSAHVKASTHLVVTPDSRYAYVYSNYNVSYADSHDDAVVVINTATGAATTIHTGAEVMDLVVSPNSRFAYVEYDDDRVAIINPVTGTADVISTGAVWSGMAVSPDGRYGYMIPFNAPGSSDTVAVINLAEGTVATIPAGMRTAYGTWGGNAVADVVFSPDGQYTYAHNDLHTVAIINPATSTATAVDAGVAVSGIAFSPDSRWAYALDNSGTFGSLRGVAIINPATGTATRLAVDTIGSDLISFKISPDGRYAYALGEVTGGGFVTVIDTTKLTFPSGSIAPDYSANTYANTAVTFDPTANPFLPSRGLTITGVAAPDNGTAVLNGSRITYTPNNDYTGTDVFTYTVTDGLNSGTGTIAVRVDKVYEPSAPYVAGPAGTQDLFSTLADAMDSKTLQHGVYTEHVLVDGRQSLIVYIAGTMEGWIGGDQSKIRNVPAASGIVDENQVAVIKAAMTDSTEPILLVGYSQGGMDAQNIAANAAQYGLQNQIKAVVTFGSPLVQIDKYPTVHLEDRADIVPKVNLFTPTNWIAGIVNSVVNKNVYLASSPNDFDTAVLTNFSTWGVHGVRSTYEDVGLYFDVDKSSHWDSVRNSMAAFLNGRVVPNGYTVLNGEIVPKNTPVEF